MPAARQPNGQTCRVPGPSAPVRSAVFTTATTEAYGSTRVLLRHATALAEAGVRVAVLHDAPSDTASEPTTALDDLIEGGGRVRPIAGLTSWRSLPPLRAVLRAVAEFDPELLVSTQVRDAAPTAVLARRLGIPFVALVQNHPRFSGSAPIAKAKWLAYRQALRSADRVICVADHVAAIVADDLGVDPSRLGVVQNLIELGPPPVDDPSARAEIRRSLDVADGAFLIVNVGRFHRQKGQLDLVEAVSALPDRSTAESEIVVVFIGDVEATGSGEYLAQLRRSVTDTGLDSRVRWAGFRNDVAAVLDAADLFVSSSRWEAGPSLAVLEAMAAQCAVLATDHGERLEGFVDEVHGLYVPAADPAALARGMRWMIERTTDERRAMGRRARQLVEARQQQIASGPGFVEQIRLALDAR